MKMKHGLRSWFWADSLFPKKQELKPTVTDHIQLSEIFCLAPSGLAWGVPLKQRHAFGSEKLIISKDFPSDTKRERQWGLQRILTLGVTRVTVWTEAAPGRIQCRGSDGYSLHCRFCFSFCLCVDRIELLPPHTHTHTHKYTHAHAHRHTSANYTHTLTHSHSCKLAHILTDAQTHWLTNLTFLTFTHTQTHICRRSHNTMHQQRLQLFSD